MSNQEPQVDLTSKNFAALCRTRFLTAVSALLFRACASNLLGSIPHGNVLEPADLYTTF